MGDLPLRQSPKAPAHQQVYQQIREMILYGALAPGEPITILGLIDRLGAGMTPVREALRRLTAEGALQLLGNRRVVVPELDCATLEELAFARLAIEPHLAGLAVLNLKNRDVSELSELDRALNAAISNGDVAGYLRLNHAFHMALYAHANAPLLVSLVDSLWLRVGPSLRVVCGRWGTMQLTDCHMDALAAMRAHDADRLVAAIREDISQGIELIAQSLAGAEARKDAPL